MVDMTTLLTAKAAPAAARQYVFVKAPVEAPKGDQRKIVLHIIYNATAPMTAHDVALLAAPLGMKAAAGLDASCGWHLHQLVLLGVCRLATTPPPVKEEVPTIDFGTETVAELVASGPVVKNGKK